MHECAVDRSQCKDAGLWEILMRALAARVEKLGKQFTLLLRAGAHSWPIVGASTGK